MDGGLIATEWQTEAYHLHRVHTTSSFSIDENNTGILGDSISIFNNRPTEPQEASTFTAHVSITQSSTEYPLIAASDSWYIQDIEEFADPCGSFTFSVTSSLPRISWEAVSRNLLLTSTLAGDTVPAVSLRSSIKFEVLPSADGVRVSISPSWWSDATSFTLVGLYHAGQLVPMPPLPVTITVVHVNLAPTIRGRLWTATRNGDITEVVAAIKGGCSTEETDEKVQF